MVSLKVLLGQGYTTDLAFVPSAAQNQKFLCWCEQPSHLLLHHLWQKKFLILVIQHALTLLMFRVQLNIIWSVKSYEC